MGPQIRSKGGWGVELWAGWGACGFSKLIPRNPIRNTISWFYELLEILDTIWKEIFWCTYLNFGAKHVKNTIFQTLFKKVAWIKLVISAPILNTKQVFYVVITHLYNAALRGSFSPLSNKASSSYCLSTFHSMCLIPAVLQTKRTIACSQLHNFFSAAS